MTIEAEREEDGRWVAEVLDISGALAHGGTRAAAIANVQVLALRVMVERLEHDENVPDLTGGFPGAA